MRKLSVYLLVVLIGGALLFLIKEDNSWKDFGVNILATAFVVILEVVFENFGAIKLFIQTNTKYRKRRIRLSISYLYQIEILGKYFLVKGNRIDQYQPVGGVYKRFRESFYELRNLDVMDDNNIPIDDKSHRDLRVNVPGENVLKFLKWFNSQLGREVSPHREFHEELISTHIIDAKNFPYPNYIYLYRKQTPIHWSKHFNCYEILIADVFKLMPNEEQINELKNLFTTTNDYYIWATHQEIENKETELGYKISETASWVI